MSSKKNPTSNGINVDNFETLTRAYLSTLQAEYEKALATGEATPELSYRPPIDDFLRKLSASINSEVKILSEPRNQANAGRPDWLLYNSKDLGLYGYIEAKGLDVNSWINIEQNKIQLEKYINLGAKVILTDGIEFIFFDALDDFKKLSLLNKPIGASDWGKLPIDPRVETEFRTFFSASGSRIISEDGLVREVAKRAAEMSVSVRELASLAPGEGLNASEEATITALHELKGLLETHHDPALNTPDVFADFVAQVLAFGLLYAHRVVDDEKDSPLERLEKIKEFWFTASYEAFTGRLRPFRAIIETLRDELNSPGRLGVWYQDCLLLLAHIKLDNAQRATPDYHTLYQTFLNAFAPNIRFDFGAYMTPPELTAYTVKLTQTLIKREMKGVSLYAKNNKIIDPCCGTATFLEHIIKFADNPASLPQITGFEILPAPYALAHYRLSMLNAGKPLPNGLEVVLTNTLSDELEHEIATGGATNLIKREQDIARKLCRPPLTLVIGNPPSSDSYTHADGGSFEIIKRLIDDFRPPEENRTGRQNIQKQLKNPFVKFLRWSCAKLEGKNPGILALVLPASFAEKESYKYARKWIAERFPKIWVVDLDEDLRTGSGASSLFYTQQGRLLLICLTAEMTEEKDTKLHYSSITRFTRKEKINWLAQTRSDDELMETFESFGIDNNSYSFFPSTSYNTRLYSRFWSIYSTDSIPDNANNFVFARHSSGIKLAPSSLFFHISRSLLTRRSREIGNVAGLSVSALLAQWFTGQSKPPKPAKLSPAVRNAFANALKEPEENLVRYSYRPLLNPFALLSEEALRTLATMKNSGTRARPEILAAFKNTSTVGIAIAPDTKDIGAELHRFVSFCWYLPDNDLCKRGNSQILCNFFPDYKPTGRSAIWNSQPRLNINERLLKHIKTEAGLSDKNAAEQLVFYSYAILCSNAYLKKFKGVLFAASDSETSPRIPIPADGNIFLKISKQGKALAELEKAETPVKISENLNELLLLFSSPFKLTSFRIESAANTINLYEDTALKLSISPVSSEILAYKVAGYQVIQQWLKAYSHSYTRADFSEVEFKELIELLARIDGQINLIKEIDVSLNDLLSDDKHLLTL
jgi:SAM-dependent methyltransferase